LPTTPVIVSIVKDPALSRALAFALRAYGYEVATFRSWKLAEQTVRKATCVILDSCLPDPDREACLASLGAQIPVLFLAENEMVNIERPCVQVLYKPLTGPDIVTALMTIRKNP
jgi:DNA-binding response OmpR family regulator